VIHALDHVLVSVSDLEAASASYETLLGRRPSWRGEHPGLGTENALFRLGNGYLELLAPAGAGAFADQLRARIAERGEGPLGLAFATDDGDACAKLLRERGVAAADPLAGQGRERTSGAERRWRNVMLPPEATRGVMVFCIEHETALDVLPVAEPTADSDAVVEGFDHVVVTSKDPDATRAFYGDQLGLRLALDKTFEKYGSRLLFFRVGGVTIEIGGRLGEDLDPDAPDEFWGIAYRVPDIAVAHARLAASEADVSEIRTGRKAGTRVFTARAPTHGVATLVIGGDGP